MMKKLIFILAIFMVFTVKSFAYSGNASYNLYEVGSLSESITMNSLSSAGCNMGGFNPGYVEVNFYAGDDSGIFHCRWDYPNSYSVSGRDVQGSGPTFYWLHPTSWCEVTVAVYYILNPGYPNGVNLSWVD